MSIVHQHHEGTAEAAAPAVSKGEKTKPGGCRGQAGKMGRGQLCSKRGKRPSVHAPRGCSHNRSLSCSLGPHLPMCLPLPACCAALEPAEKGTFQSWLLKETPKDVSWHAQHCAWSSSPGWQYPSPVGQPQHLLTAKHAFSNVEAPEFSIKAPAYATWFLSPYLAAVSITLYPGSRCLTRTRSRAGRAAGRCLT